MSIASFADKIFEVSSDKIHTFSDFQFGTGLDAEKQDNPGAKPKTYIKGPDLSTLSIKITVSEDIGLDPRTEIEDWTEIKDSETAYPFIIGGKPFGAERWVLKDVQVADVKIDNLGIILSATISLGFEEYVYAGAAKEKESKAKETTSVYNALSPSQKKELK